MDYALALVRVLPFAFFGRLAVAFAEIVVACVLVSGSVVLGHDLSDWRAWYWDADTTHPWAPTPKATATDPANIAVVATPTSVATPRTVTTPAPAALPTPTPACEPTSGATQLAFMRPVPGGADCVWFKRAPDGEHLVVKPGSLTTRDLGVVSMPLGTPELRAFAPSEWGSPVLVVTGSIGADAGGVIVFGWQPRGVVEFFRGGGNRLEVTTDAAGWPRVSVSTRLGITWTTQTYAWNGQTFAEQ